jgi:hypothetical protein
MKPIRFLAIAAASLVAGTCSGADAAECRNEAYTPEQYQVFIDQPTGYAFIKTPCGWHFVRQLETEKIAKAILVAHSLPPTAENSISYASTPEKVGSSGRQNDIR